MFRKNYFTFLLATALFLMSGIAAFAQNAPVGGRVELTKADGTKAPVAGALVEIIRLDQKLKLPTDKTDKKGTFAFAGITLGGKYALAVSGEGISPAIIPSVSPGIDLNILVSVVPGDGKRYTEDEVKQQITSRSTTNTNTTTTQTKTNTEEDKNREEAIKKQLEENEKIKKSQEIMGASMKDGNAAFNAKNYDVAVVKYEEGYNAAPTFVPNASRFLNNMALSLIKRSGINYNAKKDTDKAGAQESLKNDTQKAVEISDKVLEMLKTATPKDEQQKTDYEAQRILAVKNRKDAYFLLTKYGGERTKSKEAVGAYEEYFVIETVPADKLKGRFELAEILIGMGQDELGLAEYEKILVESPDNPDALANAGFALVNIGFNNNENKEKFQLASNYLQRFVDVAPDTHKDKAAAKETIETLKSSYKITPQKVKK